ncbi:MAG: TatD family hydrolase [Sedimenticola sp.]
MDRKYASEGARPKTQRKEDQYHQEDRVQETAAQRGRRDRYHNDKRVRETRDQRERRDRYHKDDRVRETGDRRDRYRKDDRVRETGDRRDRYRQGDHVPEEDTKRDRSERQSKRPQTTSPRQPSKKTRVSCPVADCVLEDQQPRDHVFKEHIPALLHRLRPRELKGVRVHRKRAQMIREIARILELKGGPHRLLEWTNDHFRVPEGARINGQLHREMESLCDVAGWPVPSRGFGLYPLNSPAVFLHWRALSFLMSRLSPENRLLLQDKYAQLGPQRRNVQRREGANRRRSPSIGPRPRETSPVQKTQGAERAVSRESATPTPLMDQTSPVNKSPVLRVPEIRLTTAGGEVMSLQSLNAFQRQLAQQPVQLVVAQPPAASPLRLMEPMETNQTGTPEKDTLEDTLLLDYTGTPSSVHSEIILSLFADSPTHSEEDQLLLTVKSPSGLVKSPSGLSRPLSAEAAAAAGESRDPPPKAPTFAQVVVAGRSATPETTNPPLIPSRSRTDGSAQHEGFDSHFHLDRLSRGLGQRWETTMQNISLPTEVPSQQPIHVAGGVMVFCDPEQFDRLPIYKPHFVMAVGIHPKKAHLYTPSVAQKLKGLLKERPVRALGEVGLDHSTPRESWTRQEEVLEEVLGLCDHQHVLVLHLRGTKEDRHHQEVSRQCLKMVKRLCSKDQRIHLHCFNGGMEQLQEWRAAFRNCHFGFTGMVGRFRKGQKEALRRVPADRLLLESDAPYMPMLPGLCHSSPAYIGDIAQMVAQIRTEPVSLTLSSTLANGRRLYRMYTG